jgi:hypothetical protein
MSAQREYPRWNILLETRIFQVKNRTVSLAMEKNLWQRRYIKTSLEQGFGEDQERE